MALLNWAQAHSVQVPELDRQHRGLMDLINELHSAISMGKSRAVIEALVDGLVAQTQSHFQAEEHFLRDSQYPAFESHHNEHEEMLAKLVQFRNDVHVGGIRMSLLLMDFMRTWLDHHVRGADHEYVSWLEEYARKKAKAESPAPTLP